MLAGAKQAALAVGGAFAAVKVFDFGKSALQDAADVQKANQAIRFEYGSSGALIQRFAHGAAADLGISTQTAVTTASAFGVLFKNVGIGQQKAAEMTVGFEKLAGSLSLIKNVNPAQSMQALTTAVAGNTRGLRSLGIVVTPVTELLYAANHGIIQTGDAVKAATVKANTAQAAYNTALQKYGKGTTQTATAQQALIKAQQGVAAAAQGAGQKLTPAQKAMAIYGIATQNLSKFQDEARKHSGNLADQEEILRAKFDNLKLAIGQRLLPVATEILNWGLKNTGVVKDAAIAVLTFAGTFAVLKGAIALYSEAAKAAAIVTAIFTTEQEGANAAMTANPVGLIVTALAALVVGLVYAYRHWQFFHDAVNAAGAELLKLGRIALPYIVTGLKFVAAEVARFVHFVGPSFIDSMHMIATATRETIRIAIEVWGTLRPYVMNVLHQIQAVISVVMDAIHGHWNQVWTDMQRLVFLQLHLVLSIVSSVAGAVASAAVRLGAAAYNGIVHQVSRIPGAVSGFLGRLPGILLGLAFTLASEAYNIGVAVVQGIINGMESLAASLASKAVSIVESPLNKIKSWAGITSPSKRFAAEVGLPIAQGIALGISQGVSGVQGAMFGAVTPPRGLATAGGGATVGGGHVFHFAPGSIVIHDARDPGLTARAVLDEAVRRARG